MGKITTTEELKNAILLLEEKQAFQRRMLKDQMLSIDEGLNPDDIVKNFFSKVTASPDLKSRAINTAIGLASFYFTGKTIFSSGRNPLTNILGRFLQSGVSNIISKNPKTIKSMSHAIFNGIFHKKTERN